MAQSTPSLNAVLQELTNISPTKVGKLSTALDVPKRVFEESQANHPRDVYRWKSDVVDWWVRNKKVSWEALAKALESPEVEERNIARQIRFTHSLGKPKGNRKSCNRIEVDSNEEVDSSSQRLTIEDLKIVSELLWSIRAYFYQLGVVLGIDAGTLDVFKKQADYDAALTDVIKVWLKRANPTPTWKALVIALRHQSIANSALANEIAEKYCPGEVEEAEPVNHGRIETDYGGKVKSSESRKKRESDGKVSGSDQNVGSLGNNCMLVVVSVVVVIAAVGFVKFMATSKVTAVDNGSPSGSPKLKDSVQSFPHMNERPTMNQLSLLERKAGGNEVRIIERIGTKHTELGTILLNDEHGVVMEIIKENARGNAEATNREMFRRWLAGSGAAVTWKVLVVALMEVKEKALANDIVDALRT